MTSFRYQDEYTTPPARQITPTTIERFEHVFEVDPSLMTDNVTQQVFPNWDTKRIVAARWDHLAWIHAHFADSVISGEELLRSLDD
ncbi:MAG: hypothetical protein WCI29_02535 [Actinomycetes bacterium]|jgi:hypothetical protein